MSDERFKVDYEVGVLDTKTNEIICDTVNAEEVVDLLNEQQATINEQKEAIEYLKTVIRYTIPNQMVADVFKEIGEEYE